MLRSANVFTDSRDVEAIMSSLACCGKLRNPRGEEVKTLMTETRDSKIVTRCLLLLLVIILVGTSLPASSASYLLQLSNGAEFTTRHYWVEGDQVMFYIYGGAMGIQQDSIKNITESMVAVHETRVRSSLPTKTVDQEVPRAVERPQTPIQGESKSDDPTLDVNAYRGKKRVLLTQLERVRKRYLDAMGKKESDGTERARQEMIEFGRQIYDLADQVKQKNQGVIPDWWEQITPESVSG
jgi:hypothetical protein